MFEAVYQIYEDTDFNSKYRLKKYLGSGSYGLVFLADEVIADRWMRQVALKIFRSDRAPADSILRELQLVCSFNHDYILRCFAPEQGSLQSPKGQTEECFALVMEVASTSLDRYLENQTLSPSEVTEIVRGMAKALIYLQEQNFVHRDIKPENILQVEGRWKIADFGIARLLNNATVTNTKPLGTSFYMPPEALQGDGMAAVSFAWDVWSLGVMMTVMLSGQRPFPSRTINGLIQQVLNEEPSLPTLPQPYDEIIRGCLIKNRKQRWTAQQVLNALDNPTDSKAQRSYSTPSVVEVSSSPSQFSSQLQTFTFETVRIKTEERGWLFPSFDVITQRQRGEAQQEVIDLGKGVKLEMVVIPGGSFLMGSPETDERPQHRVEVPGFLMGKYQVTQAQYEAIMGENPSDSSGANNPVDDVTWNDAKEFCKRLSEKTGREYRLPSEAEWEYACRAGTTTPFYFGETITTDLANYDGNYTYGNGKKGVYRIGTTPVGSFPPNAFGLYDMHGNVYEWCEDVSHGDYEGAPNDGSPWLTGGNHNTRMLRGGSWDTLPRNCRCAHRYGYLPVIGLNDVGFRVVSSAVGTL